MKVTHHYKQRKAPRGFSLLEMVIVMGIIALLIGGAWMMMGGALDAGKFTRVDGDMSAIESNLMTYKTMAGRYPTQNQGLDALVNKPSTAPVPSRWTQIMTALPSDPWENDYVYKFPGSIDSSKPEVISAGPDGQMGTEDDISSQQLKE